MSVSAISFEQPSPEVDQSKRPFARRLGQRLLDCLLAATQPLLEIKAATPSQPGGLSMDQLEYLWKDELSEATRQMPDSQDAFVLAELQIIPIGSAMERLIANEMAVYFEQLALLTDEC